MHKFDSIHGHEVNFTCLRSVLLAIAFLNALLTLKATIYTLIQPMPVGNV